MPCGNTSQLINVKPFRKTPYVPFSKYTFSGEVKTPSRPLLVTLFSYSSLQQQPQQLCKLICNCIVFFLCLQKADKYPRGRSMDAWERATLQCSAGGECARIMSLGIIMMANYAISKGLCLASLSQETDDRNQFSD